MFLTHTISSLNFLLVDIHDTQCPMVITPSAHVTGNVFGDREFVILNYDEVILKLGNPQLIHDSALGKVKMVCALNRDMPQCEIWIPAKCYPVNSSLYSDEKQQGTFRNLKLWKKFRDKLALQAVNGDYPALEQPIFDIFL